MEFTGGVGVDHVVEVGGAATLSRSFGALRVGGKVTLIGGFSGGATELNPGLIFSRRANVQGISVGSTQMFEAMNRAVEANAIKPVIDKVFPFAEAKAAYHHMASGAHFGKIVIARRVTFSRRLTRWRHAAASCERGRRVARVDAEDADLRAHGRGLLSSILAVRGALFRPAPSSAG